jgi:hypothetical protein
MEERRGLCWVLVGRPETKNCLEDLEVDVRNGILRRGRGRHELD